MTVAHNLARLDFAFSDFDKEIPLEPSMVVDLISRRIFVESQAYVSEDQ
ncbi:MAG: hypothetical protein JSR99_01190 [Proteobacteria bacterium]|nr:hypothetical protein [Pseudomonadota bacterium]